MSLLDQVRSAHPVEGDIPISVEARDALVDFVDAYLDNYDNVRALSPDEYTRNEDQMRAALGRLRR